MLAQYKSRRGKRKYRNLTNKETIDQHLTNIESLNGQINAAEEEMVKLKTRYEATVKDRNSVGMHLLDRNDELCILYERLNIQQDVLKRGEKALQDLEDEIRKLSLVSSELKRKIELEKHLLPKANETKNQISRLEKELVNVRKTVTTMSIKMESPEDPNRCRHLKGRDPPRKELMEKIQSLESSLSQKEV